MFDRDAEVVRAAVARDPAYAGVDLVGPLDAMGQAPTRDDFLLAAMRAMAVAGNGHSRVIPNEAIRVCPVRIVSRGEGFVLWRDGAWRRIVAVNGRDVGAVFANLRLYLAGTEMRQRVIGALLLAWPAALGAEVVRYALEAEEIKFGPRDLVAASVLYPVGETGMRRVGHDDFARPGGAAVQWDGTLWRVRIADNKAVSPDVMREAAREIGSAPRAGVVVDLRGNPGGDFTRALPLIDGLRGRAGRVAVLVDRFTFSAGIVVALLSQHHVGARIFGEEMGDGLRFWAEGGTVSLPQTGAQVRWSDGWHDWDSGHATAQTPREIARHMVGVGGIRIAGPAAEAAAWAAG
ncbi:MAG: hypothetical protein AAFN94_12410 [Pseudomonadota bacterium]